MDGQNSFDYSVEDKTWHDFRVGLGIDLVFVWVFEIDLVVVYGPKMTPF